MAAVNQSSNFTITPVLVDAMVKEAAKLQKELDSIVRLPAVFSQLFHRLFRTFLSHKFKPLQIRGSRRVRDRTRFYLSIIQC